MSGPRSWPPPGPELDPETPSDAEYVNSPQYWAGLEAYEAASMDAQHQEALAETRPARPRPQSPGQVSSPMTSAGKDQAMYRLNLTDAEWEAWAEGANIDGILAGRPRPSLAARVAESFKGEPEAGP